MNLELGKNVIIDIDMQSFNLKLSIDVFGNGCINFLEIKFDIVLLKLGINIADYLTYYICSFI